MNYCFNCGARITDENQNFCIECGADLKAHDKKYNDFRRDSRKKYNQREGESYNDYLNRINSPLKDITATEDNIKEESLSYRDYDPLKNMKEPKINYPKENSYNNARDDNNLSYDSQIADEDIADEDIADENKKEIIVEGMFGKPLASTEGNFIVEGMFGRPKYHIDGNIIRENNQFGKPAYRIDGNYIREGMFGKPKYYIDGDLIKENNQFGRVVGRKKRL